MNNYLQLTNPSPTLAAMKSANPRIEALKELIALEEERATVQGELTAVEQRIAVLKISIFSGSPAASTSISASPSKAKAGRPSGSKNAGKGGTYRETIMAALEAAGEVGVRVKDLALSMKTKPVNIHSWFHSNLKKIPSIKKITGGHYCIIAGAKSESAEAIAAPAPKVARKASTVGKGTKRGALSASILEHLTAAGSAGMKISDLADKLGAKYKNVYIWFATTGKKNPGIKRIAPATYQLKS